MNTGQMLLVIGALALLSTITLSVNRTLLENDEVVLEIQSGVLAIALAEGEIGALVATGYDSLSIGLSTDTLSTPFAAFACTTRVDYVQAADVDQAVTDSTSLKRVQVAVANEYMVGSVTLSALVGDY